MGINLKADIDAALKLYPLLKIIEKDGILGIAGDLELIHPEFNIPFETFSVELSFPKEYPNCFPRVLETGGKIERIPNRHVYTNTGTLCLAVPPEERLLCRHGINMSRFIKNVLLPRLGEEYNVNNGGQYSREYSHGPDGFWEFYFKKFDTDDPNIVLKILKCITEQNTPKGFELCICGINEKYKKCHREAINEISCLGIPYLKWQLNYLNENKFIKKSVN